MSVHVRRGAGGGAAALLALVCLLVVGASARAAIGDAWRTVRGDRSPGASWTALVATANGRLIGAGNSGWLMVSDDGGTSWDYRRMIIDGEPERVSFSDIVEFGIGGSAVSRRLAAVGVWMEDGRDWNWAAKTYLFLSDDNGNSWRRVPFPQTRVTGTPWGEFEGIDLPRLHPYAGGLLAYGTTSVSSNGIIVWSIGGLIYRSGDGESWTRSSFELGPIFSMTDAGGGRLAAAGVQTVTDSADGAGWNGYLLRDAGVTVGGEAMPYEERRRLVAEHVVWHGGQYVLMGASVVPLTDNILTTFADTLYGMNAVTPFDGARAWSAREQPRRYGLPFSTGSALVSVGPTGVYSSGNGGASWSWHSWDPVVHGRALAKAPSSDWYGIGGTGTATPGDGVWRTGNGTSWTKIFEAPEDPDLFPMGVHGSTLFACTGDFRLDEVWRSEDNGETWAPVAEDVGHCASRIVVVGSRLLFANGRGVMFSDDGGSTWQPREVLPENLGVSEIARSGSRIVLMPPGRSVTGQSPIYVSDDAGDNWQELSAPLQWNEEVTTIGAAYNGRIIAGAQFNAPFYPKLIISDDGGQSWRVDESLQTTPGLYPIVGQDPHNGLAIEQIVRAGNGRLLLRGESEILTSDDNGDTWTVRIATYHTNGVRGGPWVLDLGDVVNVGDRWVAPATVPSYIDDPPGGRNWVLVSDDGGDSWYRRPVPTNYAHISRASAAAGSRAVLFGSRGAVIVGDAQAGFLDAPERILVRAGDTLTMPVQRPPIPGALDVRYAAIPDRDAPTGEAAQIEVDFEAVSGTLHWDDGDDSPREIAVPTFDTGVDAADRRMLVQLITDGDTASASTEVPVTILNTSAVRAHGIDVLDADTILLRVGGAPGTFRIVLARQPTAEVVITLENVDAGMATVSPTTLTFGPGDWKQPQTVTVTPPAARAKGDGSGPRAGSAYQVALRIDSADAGYANLSDTYASYRYENLSLFRDSFEPEP